VWLGGGVLGILGIPGTGHPDADADADGDADGDELVPPGDAVALLFVALLLGIKFEMKMSRTVRRMQQ